MQKKFSSYEILEKLRLLICSEDIDRSIKIPGALPEKEEFEDFTDIAYQVFDNILLEKYKKVSIKTKKKLILFTWVIPSGLGDLSMQVHIAKILSEKNPTLKIELISLIDERSFLPKSLRSHLPHHIIRYKHPKAPVFDAAIQKLLQEAFSIIEIPTAYFNFQALKEMIIKNSTSPPIISRIGQYGFIDTEDYNPSTRERSMGLYPLEKGIIALKNIPPQKRNLNRYFAYLITKNGIITYLLSILLHRKKDNDNLTIIVPNLGKILPILKEIDFKELGIKTIEIRDAPYISNLEITKEGKILTIEHHKNLNPALILSLMATSNPFVGIRGDGSFTECLSTDALFFYDALDHAIPFLKDLSHIANTELLPYFSLSEYLPLLYKNMQNPITRAKKIALLLDDPSLVIGMKKLRHLLQKNYSFNNTLDNLIKQNYSFYIDPSLKEKEEQAFKNFLEGKISLPNLLNT